MLPQYGQLAGPSSIQVVLDGDFPYYLQKTAGTHISGIVCLIQQFCLATAIVTD
jgi:hypothetical protein